MITVNGKEVTLTGPLSVADYLEQNNYQIKRIAVEMNGDILPKYSYSDTMLLHSTRVYTKMNKVKLRLGESS